MRTVEYHLESLRLSVAADSEIGHRYRANFDQLHLEPLHPLMIVADGMGDSPGALLAGQTTVEVLTRRITAAAAPAPAPAPAPATHTPDITPDLLREAVAAVQSEVRTAGANAPDLTGCTLTALVADRGQQAWIVQVGDSRAYRLRAGLLELLTVDHTAAWLGAVYGWYNADSQQAARARYHLLRYVGDPAGSEPDLINVSLRPGDVYCLCTDGVAEQVSYQAMGAAMGESNPQIAVARMLAACEASGGRDNATVVVARVDG